MGTIRACGPADLERMCGIINEAAQAYKAILSADDWHEPYMDAGQLRREIDAGVAFSGWEDDGELQAIMGLQHVAGATLIRHAYVAAPYQRKGIGGILLKALRRHVQGPLLVGTWADARWAIDFYERHGFTLVDRQRGDRLLRTYWTIPDRQREISVVLSAG